MTKVEELRQKLLEIDNDMGEQTIDLLIAAARAEGAEQEAAKVVHCYECVGGDENTPEKEQCVMWTEGKKGYCSRGKRVPASLLAPDKEGEK